MSLPIDLLNYHCFCVSRCKLNSIFHMALCLYYSLKFSTYKVCITSCWYVNHMRTILSDIFPRFFRCISVHYGIFNTILGTRALTFCKWHSWMADHRIISSNYLKCSRQEGIVVTEVLQLSPNHRNLKYFLFLNILLNLCQVHVLSQLRFHFAQILLS